MLDSAESGEQSAVETGDFELMQRAGQGDERAFTVLVERHHRAVIGTITRMLGDETEAHDLAQLTFLRVWRAAPRYHPSAKFTTWLFTIVRNLVFNESRRRSTAKLGSLEVSNPDDAPYEHATSEPSPTTQLQASELEQAIQDAIQALPEQQRLAVVLRRYEDLSYEEIAEVMEMTTSAVKSLLTRARSNLRDVLEPYLQQGTKVE